MNSMPKELSWLLETPLQPPTVLSHWDGFPNIMLFKISSGALLWWLFEDNEDEELGVFVHLTSEEAQAVYRGPKDQGLLEPIRHNMSDRLAVVWNRQGERIKVARFVIPANGTEPEFADLLWNTAELVGVSRNTEARSTIQAGRVAHDLARLARV
ncbi:hypothetical protein [Nocardia sputi]|uniref:hypothetical protein n=1 Tax=Nocardia sputi TaxID=2943705 RepID=UPI0020BFCC30|nr:hypothetical protein [Nocardia sputi]